MSRPKILLVDDLPNNLQALAAVLEPLSLDVVQVTSGEGALREVLLHDFVAILLDVQMPGMDGLQTAQIIKAREHSRHTPILFITANSREDAFAQRSYEYGAVDYILKPLQPGVLRAKVQVFVDLYEMRRKLRETKEKEYEELAESMPQIVWRADARGTITYCNRRWSEQSLQHKGPVFRWSDLAMPEEAEALLGAWKAAVAKKTPWTREQRIGNAKMGYRWHLLRALPQLAPSGEVKNWIGTATDIEDNKGIAQKLAEANRAKDVFLATLSHELRTPLNAMLGWTQLLKQGALDEGRRAHALDAIERNVNVQTRLIEELLDISSIVSEKVRLEKMNFDLAQILQVSAESLRLAVQEKGVSLVTETDKDLFVDGDSERLQQVFTNLLGNAVKFTPRAGTVTLRAKKIGAEVVITVSDTGAGISADFLPHVFKPFQQGEGAGARRYGGLGLGLAIVHRLIDLHGGDVCAQSDGHDKGATFTVTLPAASAEKTAPAAVPPRKSRSLDGVRVLLVEDAEDSAELLVLSLSRSGAIVKVATTVREASQALAEEIPEVLLSDFNLPDGHGIELVRLLRAREHGDRAVAIATTAAASRDAQKSALSAGFDAHLSKPFDLEALLECVSVNLQRKR